MLREEEHIKDIDANEFAKVFTPEIKQVIKVIREYGFDLRVVGGAVRDFLRGQSPLSSSGHKLLSGWEVN